MKRIRKIISIQLPSMVAMFSKVRGTKIPSTKKHRPKKGGAYKRATEKRRTLKEI